MEENKDLFSANIYEKLSLNREKSIDYAIKKILNDELLLNILKRRRVHIELYETDTNNSDDEGGTSLRLLLEKGRLIASEICYINPSDYNFVVNHCDSEYISPIIIEEGISYVNFNELVEEHSKYAKKKPLKPEKSLKNGKRKVAEFFPEKLNGFKILNNLEKRVKEILEI